MYDHTYVYSTQNASSSILLIDQGKTLTIDPLTYKINSNGTDIAFSECVIL